MSILSRLFGRKDAALQTQVREAYKGFQITPMPAKSGNAYRIGATITGTVDGVEKVHHLIRADTLEGFEAAQQASINKAKQMIDEQGARLFDGWTE